MAQKQEILREADMTCETCSKISSSFKNEEFWSAGGNKAEAGFRSVLLPLWTLTKFLIFFMEKDTQQYRVWFEQNIFDITYYLMGLKLKKVTSQKVRGSQ